MAMPKVGTLELLKVILKFSEIRECAEFLLGKALAALKAIRIS